MEQNFLALSPCEKGDFPTRKYRLIPHLMLGVPRLVLGIVFFITSLAEI